MQVAQPIVLLLAIDVVHIVLVTLGIHRRGTEESSGDLQNELGGFLVYTMYRADWEIPLGRTRCRRCCAGPADTAHVRTKIGQRILFRCSKRSANSYSHLKPACQPRFPSAHCRLSAFAPSAVARALASSHRPLAGGPGSLVPNKASPFARTAHKLRPLPSTVPRTCSQLTITSSTRRAPERAYFVLLAAGARHLLRVGRRGVLRCLEQLRPLTIARAFENEQADHATQRDPVLKG